MLLRKNICWKCQHWEECFKYRYGNQKQSYMEKIVRDRDEWGELVIYVEKCKKYKYEKQRDLHKEKNARIYDIIYSVEDYYINNLGNRYN